MPDLIHILHPHPVHTICSVCTAHTFDAYEFGFTTLRLCYAQPRAWAEGHRVAYLCIGCWFDNAWLTQQGILVDSTTGS
eukprot:363883-Chlamydomonas_euryale.AAC.17